MMTPVFSPEDFAALGGPDLVYVRPILGAEVLASVPSIKIEGELAPDQIKPAPEFNGTIDAAYITGQVLVVDGGMIV